MTGLGLLDGGGFSDARDISADGAVIVGLASSTSGQEAFRWDSVDGMVGLGDLNVAPPYLSAAFGVSADGSVIVGFGNSASGQEAFRWEDGVMSPLGDLDGGSFESRANGVSGDGSVVVGYGNSPEGQEAFRWDNGCMRSLKDLLVDDYGLDLTGWTLDQALAVSADGSTMVGYGTNPDGIDEGWIATIAGSSSGIRLDGPSEATVNDEFELDVSCANADSLVRVAAGRDSSGSSRFVPGCGVVLFDIGPRANNFGSLLADADGNATSSQTLGGNFGNSTIYYQALDASSCELSNVLTVVVNDAD